MAVSIPLKYRELGRIRIGERGAKGEPQRLETFRLTSQNKILLERGADLWGGRVEPWLERPGAGSQWELITEVSELPVWVPRQRIRESQYFQWWSRGGCQRRCNGEVEQISGRACLCAQSGERKCSLITHLQVILPDLPDIGIWRMVTTSFHAAQELPGSVEFFGGLESPADPLPEASLAVELRSSKANGQTRHFPVPVLRLGRSPRELVALASGLPPQDRPALISHAQEQQGVTKILTGIREKMIHVWNESPAVLSAYAELRYGKPLERLSLSEAKDLQGAFLRFKSHDELVAAYSAMEFQTQENLQPSL